MSPIEVIEPTLKKGDVMCSGTGTILCNCGGDLCVCGLDGSECPGCQNCFDYDDFDCYQCGDEGCHECIPSIKESPLVIAITDDWLTRVGFTSVDGVKYHHSTSLYHRKWCLIKGEHSAYAFVCMGTCFSVQKTRQDARDVCSVMAATLTED